MMSWKDVAKEIYEAPFKAATQVLINSVSTFIAIAASFFYGNIIIEAVGEYGRDWFSYYWYVVIFVILAVALFWIFTWVRFGVFASFISSIVSAASCLAIFSYFEITQTDIESLVLFFLYCFALFQIIAMCIAAVLLAWNHAGTIARNGRPTTGK